MCWCIDVAVAIVTPLYRPVCLYRLKGFIVMRPILTGSQCFQSGALTHQRKIKEDERWWLLYLSFSFGKIPKTHMCTCESPC